MRMQDIFTTLNDLLEYYNLNKEGFRKVIKKHDKVWMSLSQTVLSHVPVSASVFIRSNTVCSSRSCVGWVGCFTKGLLKVHSY